MYAKNIRSSATIESRAIGALKLASEARGENVPAKRADFLFFLSSTYSLHIVEEIEIGYMHDFIQSLLLSLDLFSK